KEKRNQNRMIASSIHNLLFESVHPNVEEAKKILVSTGKMNDKDAHRLSLEMAKADPYPDKRFTPIIAKWHTKKLPWKEHVSDIAEYKELRNKVKNLKINVKEQKGKHVLQYTLLKANHDYFEKH